MSSYDVLGVNRAATDAEIAAAYRALAKQFHPDQHPEATPAARAQWQQAMAVINGAYEDLKDHGRREAYDRSSADSVSHEASATNLRSPVVGECDLCGSKPAEMVEFRMQNAWLLRFTTYMTRLELCRSCAQAVGRAAQSRTLWSGWLGVRAPFVNFGHLVHNSDELHRVAQWVMPS